MNRTLTLVSELVHPERRALARTELGRALEGSTVLVFLLDRQVGRHLPAPGFPMTYPEGRRWAAFLERCAADGRAVEPLPMPGGREARCAGIGVPEIVLVLADSGSSDALEEIRPLLPLLSAALGGEVTAEERQAEAEAARMAARSAAALASAVDDSRRKLQAALAELQELDRRKDEFLAMLGHELRNPLAPIMTSTTLLRQQKHDPASVERTTDVIDRQLRQLIRLVDDLLDVARVTRGKLTLRKQPIDVLDVIRRALDSVSAIVLAKRHQVDLVAPEERLVVDADLVRLEQVFVNLLNNAAKYTDAGGRIRVTVRREDGQVAVSVADDGIGIGADFLPRVFDLFAQGSRGLDRALGGLGVGLALVRRLVEMHGGTIDARSEGTPGRGSEFTVRLPLASMAAEPAESGRAWREAGTRRNVLVVDDNVDAAETLAQVLAAWGHRVRVAYDGLAALASIDTDPPEVVLLDLGLPGLDGLQVAERIRATHRVRTPRLVAISGYAFPADRARSHGAGFAAHLSKPVDLTQLRSLLD